MQTKSRHHRRPLIHPKWFSGLAWWSIQFGNNSFHHFTPSISEYFFYLVFKKYTLYVYYYDHNIIIAVDYTDKKYTFLFIWNQNVRGFQSVKGKTFVHRKKLIYISKRSTHCVYVKMENVLLSINIYIYIYFRIVWYDDACSSLLLGYRFLIYTRPCHHCHLSVTYTILFYGFCERSITCDVNCVF